MSTPDPGIAAGDVRFFDNYIPALEADEYVLTVKQTVSSTDKSLDQNFKATQTLSVAAPRFAVPSADIHSRFPPPNTSGMFEQNFAHIVLNARVLPWERLIDETDASTRGTPWVALLLFTPDEIIPPASTPNASALTNPTLAGNYPVSPPRPDGSGAGAAAVDSLLKPADPTILGPNVNREDTDETACQAIDISTATFQQIVPRMAELPFLAHVREAGAALHHKATDQASGDGWFSVVIGNRFPASASGAATRNIAHLVSLEGFSGYLDEQPTWPPGITKVRLASLASWSFICQPEGGDFAALALNLIAGPIGSMALVDGGTGYSTEPDVAVTGGGGSGALVAASIADGAVSALTLVTPGSGYSATPSLAFTGGAGTGAAATATLLAEGGDMLRLRLPFSPTSHPPRQAAEVQAALQQGFVALAYNTRVGDRTFGWYHGPLVPNPVEPLAGADLWQSSAAATIYGKETGTFDLTYAAAWETGRLLALAARAQARSNMALRKSLRRGVNCLRGRADLGLEAALGVASDETAPLGPAIVGWFANNLAQRLPKPGEEVRAAGTPVDAAALPRRAAAEQLRSMIDRPEVKEHLARSLGKASTEPEFTTAIDFQAGLRLLEGVPFSTLVPDSAMLPAESIRFFYVDPNYLSALSDGANSLGLHTSRDIAHAKALREPLNRIVAQRARTIRSRRTGRAGTTTVGAGSGDPVAGFLLRSALVAGWPGLEVKAYAATVPGSDPIRPNLSTLVSPLRLERLAPDVLLCLYPQIPVWIELDEPNEGLAFGVEDPTETGGAPQVALRYLDNSDGRMGLATGTDVSFTSSYLRAAAAPATPRVVDIAGWQAYLCTQVPPSTTDWGPAAFAVEMVRAPEQIVFQIKRNPE
jgi:hypothetical protein